MSRIKGDVMKRIILGLLLLVWSNAIAKQVTYTVLHQTKTPDGDYSLNVLYDDGGKKKEVVFVCVKASDISNSQKITDAVDAVISKRKAISISTPVPVPTPRVIQVNK
jgi:hypothetical protein